MSIFSLSSFLFVSWFREFISSSKTVKTQGTIDNHKSPIAPSTIWIQNLPRHITDNNLLLTKLEEKYPSKLFEVQIIVDVEQLEKIGEERDYYLEVKKHYSNNSSNLVTFTFRFHNLIPRYLWIAVVEIKQTLLKRLIKISNSVMFISKNGRKKHTKEVE